MVTRLGAEPHPSIGGFGPRLTTPSSDGAGNTGPRLRAQ
jgi:hypothetical protein